MSPSVRTRAERSGHRVPSVIPATRGSVQPGRADGLARCGRRPRVRLALAFDLVSGPRPYGASGACRAARRLRVAGGVPLGASVRRGGADGLPPDACARADRHFRALRHALCRRPRRALPWFLGLTPLASRRRCKTKTSSRAGRPWCECMASRAFPLLGTSPATIRRSVRTRTSSHMWTKSKAATVHG